MPRGQVGVEVFLDHSLRRNPADSGFRQLPFSATVFSRISSSNKVSCDASVSTERYEAVSEGECFAFHHVPKLAMKPVVVWF